MLYPLPDICDRLARDLGEDELGRIANAAIAAAIISGIASPASAQEKPLMFSGTPTEAMAKGLEGCQAVLGGADPQAAFADLATLDPPMPAMRENESPAVNDAADFFGEGTPIRAGIAPLAGLVVMVDETSRRCQAMLIDGNADTDAVRATLGQGWTWSENQARRGDGATARILRNDDGAGYAPHLTVQIAPAR